MSLRLLVAATVAAMAAVPLAASGAPWTQAGYDAARTGHVPDAGPLWNETAFTIRLPGDLFHQGDFMVGPRIADGYAYVPVVPADDGRDGQGVARVDLGTAEAELFIETSTPAQAVAITGELLLVPRAGGMDAYDRSTGEPIWALDYPSQASGPTQTICMEPAVRDGVAYLPCTEFEPSFGNDGGPWTPFVWAVDVGPGEQAWYRPFDYAGGDGPAGTRSAGLPAYYNTGASVVGSHVLAVTFDQQWQGTQSRVGCQPVPGVVECAWAQRTRITLWALDAMSGQIAWQNSTEVHWFDDEQLPEEIWDPVREPMPATSFQATGAGGVAYVKFDGKLQQINPNRGPEPTWEQRLGQQDQLEGIGGATSAFTGDGLYVASLQTISGFDTRGGTPTIDWTFPLDPRRNEVIGGGALVVADGVLYTMGQNREQGTVYALEAATGRLVWQHELRPETINDGGAPFVPYAYAVADGLFVAVAEDGTFHVVGQTAASLGGPSVNAPRYAPTDEPVQFEIEPGPDGAFGPPKGYRVFWGDGTSSPWQEGRTFEHVYAEPGDVTVRVQAANAANQTASTFLVLHVGAPEPNWISERFEPDNQDMTFGVLGLAVAMTGGAIGVARRHRHRSRLQDELEALESGFEGTQANPGECEALLDTRKARARSLLLDGELTEEQFGVLERRVAELHTELRNTVLDARFQFLPHGMVGSIKKMLADGRLSTWERDTLVQVLEADESLSDVQRERVRDQLDRWFAEDAGRGGA